VALAISLQVAQVHQEQVFYSVAVVVAQGALAMAQMPLITTAVTAVQVAAVVAVLLQQVLQVQAAMALSFYTTKEF
jgi:hypothetical protein